MRGLVLAPAEAAHSLRNTKAVTDPRQALKWPRALHFIPEMRLQWFGEVNVWLIYELASPFCAKALSLPPHETEAKETAAEEQQGRRFGDRVDDETRSRAHVPVRPQSVDAGECQMRQISYQFLENPLRHEYDDFALLGDKEPWPPDVNNGGKPISGSC